jgi:hypothetical protein
MQPIWGNVAALAVAVIFYTWRTWINLRVRRDRVLRERVAYLLWVLAERSDVAGSRVSVN